MYISVQIGVPYTKSDISTPQSLGTMNKSTPRGESGRRNVMRERRRRRVGRERMKEKGKRRIEGREFE